MRIVSMSEVGGDEEPTERNPNPISRVVAHIEVEFDGIRALSDDARARIDLLLRQEGERIAQIAAVDARDQVVAKKEAERIRALPKDRSHVIVNAGTKDPTAAAVVRGSAKIGGKMVHAPKEGA